MTVAAQHDFRPGPVSADGAQQATQEGAYFLAARPLGGAKNGGDETAFAVEHVESYPRRSRHLRA